MCPRGARRGNASRVVALALVGLTAAGACHARTPERDTSTVAQAPADAGGAKRGAAAASAAPPAHTVLFVGTSLTAGLGLDPDSAYPQRIQRMIDSAGLDFTVVNAGVSGETSAGLLRRLDWLLGQPFDVVVLETGANDGLRGTAVSETRSNIQQIITRIRTTHPRARVLLVQMEAPPNLGREYTTAFHATYPELARANGIVLLPFLLNGVAGHPQLNQADGMHPNNRGERIVAANVWAGVRPVLEGEVGGGKR